MPRTWTKTEAFDHFGIELENVQWSWSGMSADGGTVAVVLWQDAVKGRNGQLTYHDDEELDAGWRQRIGNKRRIEHLRHAIDRLEGKFRAVIAKAEDLDADPRKIEKCFPQDGAVWQIDYLDELTGAFRAHIVR
ncbi:MAG: hypothetical protein LC648_04625 [Novosphingobium sp.]|nr:hypothetical protein [Novosphingobium sp.]